MTNDGNSPLYQRRDRLCHVASAFQFHPMRVGLLKHAPGISDRFGYRDLVGKKRQVYEHQGTLRASAYSGRMVDHLVERGAQGSLVPRNDLIQGVSDQQDINPGLLQELREYGVVAGQHDYPPPTRLHGSQITYG